MPRQPSEQNLPDNVTNADIEKHFAYGEEQQCFRCGDPVYRDGRCRDCYQADEED